MKRFQTFFDLSGLSIFKDRLLEIVEERSKEYINNKEYPTHEIPLTKQQEVEAHMLLKENIILHTEDENKIVTFYMAHGKFCLLKLEEIKSILIIFYSQIPENDNMTDEAIQNYEANDWEQFTSFEEFMAASRQYHRIIFENNISNWKSSDCTCMKSKKEFMGSHIIAVALHLGILEPPEENDEHVQIQMNRKRGRPKRATKGLAKD